MTEGKLDRVAVRLLIIVMASWLTAGTAIAGGGEAFDIDAALKLVKEAPGKDWPPREFRLGGEITEEERRIIRTLRPTPPKVRFDRNDRFDSIESHAHVWLTFDSKELDSPEKVARAFEALLGDTLSYRTGDCLASTSVTNILPPEMPGTLRRVEWEVRLNTGSTKLEKAFPRGAGSDEILESDEGRRLVAEMREHFRTVLVVAALTTGITLMP